MSAIRTFSKLAQLLDVSIVNPQPGQTIIFNGSTLKFENQTPSSGGGSVDLSSPGPIGGTTPAAATFTNIVIHGTGDVQLVAHGANSLGVRNGANPQSLVVYGGYTNDSNFFAGYFSVDSSGNIDIANTAMGTGTTVGSVTIGTNAGGSLKLKSGGSVVWEVLNGGTFMPSGDGTIDIGVSFRRIRNGYFSGFVYDQYRTVGAGSPEGAVSAPVGAVYHRTDGGAGTSFYVKETGTSTTGWAAK